MLAVGEHVSTLAARNTSCASSADDCGSTGIRVPPIHSIARKASIAAKLLRTISRPARLPRRNDDRSGHPIDAGHQCLGGTRLPVEIEQDRPTGRATQRVAQRGGG